MAVAISPRNSADNHPARGRIMRHADRQVWGVERLAPADSLDVLRGGFLDHVDDVVGGDSSPSDGLTYGSGCAFCCYVHVVSTVPEVLSTVSHFVS